MAALVQLVERPVVSRKVKGSSPLRRPMDVDRPYIKLESNLYICCEKEFNAQAVKTHYKTIHLKRVNRRVVVWCVLCRKCFDTVGIQRHFTSCSRKEHFLLTKLCENCEVNKVVRQSESAPRFCSRFCARSFASKNGRLDKNRKISEWQKRNNQTKQIKVSHPVSLKPSSLKPKRTNLSLAQIKDLRDAGIVNKSRFCIKCNNLGVIYGGYVCEECKSIYPEYYNIQCRFQFNVYDYPELFDLSLLTKYGWYHPQRNPGGASRDHKFSVAEAFKCKVNPEIVRHPMNCSLVLHFENNRKNSKSSISLEELMINIVEYRGCSRNTH